MIYFIASLFLFSQQLFCNLQNFATWHSLQVNKRLSNLTEDYKNKGGSNNGGKRKLSKQEEIFIQKKELESICDRLRKTFNITDKKKFNKNKAMHNMSTDLHFFFYPEPELGSEKYGLILEIAIYDLAYIILYEENREDEFFYVHSEIWDKWKLAVNKLNNNYNDPFDEKYNENFNFFTHFRSLIKNKEENSKTAQHCCNEFELFILNATCRTLDQLAVKQKAKEYADKIIFWENFVFKNPETLLSKVIQLRLKSYCFHAINISLLDCEYKNIFANCSQALIQEINLAIANKDLFQEMHNFKPFLIFLKKRQDSYINELEKIISTAH